MRAFPDLRGNRPNNFDYKQTEWIKGFNLPTRNLTMI